MTQSFLSVYSDLEKKKTGNGGFVFVICGFNSCYYFTVNDLIYCEFTTSFAQEIFLIDPIIVFEITNFKQNYVQLKRNVKHCFND